MLAAFPPLRQAEDLSLGGARSLGRRPGPQAGERQGLGGLGVAISVELVHFLEVLSFLFGWGEGEVRTQSGSTTLSYDRDICI